MQDHNNLNKTVPPRDETFEEICRYIMQAASPDYPALPFIASLYTYAHKNCGLTLRQRRALDPHARLFLGYGTFCKEDMEAVAREDEGAQ